MDSGLAVRNAFSTKEGGMELIDFMPLGLPAIIRLYRSEIPFIVRIKPMFEFGLINPAVEEAENGITFRNVKGKEGLEVSIKGSYTSVDEGVVRIERGEGYVFAMYSKDLKYGLFSRNGAIYADPYEAFETTQRYWEEQISLARQVKEFSGAYYRSLAVVLGMLYLPSGAIVASPTTSLPEIIGKQRNWDYRYVWVRDAAYAVEALSNAKLVSKARRILSFLISVIDPSSKSFDHPLYSIDGTSPRPEEILYWLRGNRKSKPVRIGNEAYTQIQCDIEGAFMSAMYTYLKKSEDIPYVNENWWAVEAIMRWIGESWGSKSISLWEERHGPEHFVHTKVMNWVAADRAARIAGMIGKDECVREWDKLAKNIKEDVLANGFSKERDSFTRYYGSEDIDASLLTLPIYGFIDASDQRFIGTLRRIESELGAGEGFLTRYGSDFMGKAEHPFTLLSAWLARVYLRLGRKEDARKVLSRLISSSNEMMLIGEHVDLEAREPRGNFPQLFPHAGLIDAIIEIETI